MPSSAGFCETLLVFVFVYERDYGALAIIIAAKEFVRREKIQQNPSYYLLGTLINLSVALVFCPDCALPYRAIMPTLTYTASRA